MSLKKSFDNNSLLTKIKQFDLGYGEVLYKNKKYGVTRTDFNGGDSIKVFAKELGGSNFISLNYYITLHDQYLKPCEMPQHKVVHFLQNYKRMA